MNSYLIRYCLEFTWPNDEADQIAALMGELFEIDGHLGEVFDLTGNGELGTAQNIIPQIAQLSARHPDLVMTLWGDGEEAHDLWCCYFKGGAVQMSVATIHYDPFCEDALKPISEVTF